jgi:hypothetical protein
MENSELGRRIHIWHPANDEPLDVLAQVLEQDGALVGAEVPVASWAEVRALEQREGVPRGRREVTRTAKLILGEESGDTPA